MKFAKMSDSEKVTELEARITNKEASIAAFKKLGYSDSDLESDYASLDLLHKKLLRRIKNS